MIKIKKIFYFSENDLSFHEIKRFRLKTIVASLCCVFALIGVVLTINHFYDFLGLGYNQISFLRRENSLLEERLHLLSNQSQALHSTLSKLQEDGNNLRLMVDLPVIDEQTQIAGTGGSVGQTYSAPSNSIDGAVRDATTILDNLKSEIGLQKQSYHEISQRYEHNKEFFAAMPALKPMEGYYSPNGFGLRMHPVLGVFKTHGGVDIISDVGTPVFASGNGTVITAGHSGGGYGSVIVISHGYGYETVYAHLSQVLVKDGAHVKRGDLIAKSGKTGLVTGPHLHYEVRFHGIQQNPVDYFLDDVHPAEYQKSLAHN